MSDDDVRNSEGSEWEEAENFWRGCDRIFRYGAIAIVLIVAVACSWI